jgi:hypothetical protein
MGTYLHNLGKLFLRSGLVKKAEVLLKKSMDTCARNSDCNHPLAYENAGLLARLAAGDGKFPRAQKLAKRQWLIGKRIYGKDDPRTREPIKFLVQLYRTYGKFERADALERLIRKSIQSAPLQVQETQSFAPGSDEAIRFECSDQLVLDF